MEDYNIDELECPKCGANTHSRKCPEILCEDGQIDVSDEDFLVPDSEYEICNVCRGSGIERWCPKCGEDLSGVTLDEEDEDLF